MNLLKLTSLCLAFMMIVWSLLAITEGHYYGTVGVALNWLVLGLGIIILLVRFGFANVLKPPMIYLYVGFFVLMFLKTMGWVTI